MMNETHQNPPWDGEVAARSADGGVASFSWRERVSARFDRDLATTLAVPERKERGFTLVEMMVVIVIIGLLATVVIINVLPATDRAANTRVRADLATLEQGIEMYRLENLRYPTTEEGLNTLVPAYVRRLPNDPWNSPYVYVAPGGNGAPFRIASLGADKREGGSAENADITN